MVRNQIRQSEALRKARERQRELDREEDKARKRARARIADATAAAVTALQRRADAEQALAAATSEAGQVVRALMGEDVDVERAAALLDLDVAQLRRLLKATRPQADGARQEMAGSGAGTRSGQSNKDETAIPRDEHASTVTAERRAS